MSKPPLRATAKPIAAPPAERVGAVSHFVRMQRSAGAYQLTLLEGQDNKHV
jgi:hypothetical protein